MGQKGEIMIDQAHRGYTLATDKDGFASVNPLYMRYTPDEKGFFAGQQGYGYKSLEMFVQACLQLRSGQVTSVTEFNDSLATIGTTQIATAILEAGRQSLDLRRPIRIHYNEHGVPDALIPE
jgi:D-galacturonate reductase